MATQTNTVYAKATVAQVRQMVRALPGILNGRIADPTGLVYGLMLRVGMEALSFIKEAFVIKAKGGTDEAGLYWPKLSPKTIAYSRLHPGLNAQRAAAKSKGRPGRPLLTDKQDEQWRTIFASRVHAYEKQGASNKEAKAHAAATAWTVLKANGATTIIDKYGNTQVEILRDKGFLLNSLSPGTQGPSGDPNQVFRVNPGEVIVGTNRAHAGAHHRGVPGKVPQRRLWPEPKDWPKTWWGRITGTLQSGAAQIVAKLLRP
jgi:hypothetical protein